MGAVLLHRTLPFTDVCLSLCRYVTSLWKEFWKTLIELSFMTSAAEDDLMTRNSASMISDM